MAASSESLSPGPLGELARPSGGRDRHGGREDPETPPAPPGSGAGGTTPALTASASTRRGRSQGGRSAQRHPGAGVAPGWSPGGRGPGSAGVPSSPFQPESHRSGDVSAEAAGPMASFLSGEGVACPALALEEGAWKRLSLSERPHDGGGWRGEGTGHSGDHDSSYGEHRRRQRDVAHALECERGLRSDQRRDRSHRPGSAGGSSSGDADGAGAGAGPGGWEAATEILLTRLPMRRPMRVDWAGVSVFMRDIFAQPGLGGAPARAPRPRAGPGAAGAGKQRLEGLELKGDHHDDLEPVLQRPAAGPAGGTKQQNLAGGGRPEGTHEIVSMEEAAAAAEAFDVESSGGNIAIARGAALSAPAAGVGGGPQRRRGAAPACCAPGAGACGRGGRRAPPPVRCVLRDSEGSAEPGRLLGIMGPSGSGKTTLLTVLAQRCEGADRIDGAVLYDGRPYSRALKRVIAFVTQDDLFYDSLTVEETLSIAALLKLPRAMPRADKLQRVQDVIGALGLAKCAGSIIGGPARRGISGGERKRVAIAAELLVNPAVLFLDEPTSGLDANLAYRLVRTLNALARSGRTLATTIHQPSARMFALLDDLLLLAEGRTLYAGPAGDAVAHFSALGRPLPEGHNAAEFLLDLAAGELPGLEERGRGEEPALLRAASESATEEEGVAPAGAEEEGPDGVHDDGTNRDRTYDAGAGAAVGGGRHVSRHVHGAADRDDFKQPLIGESPEDEIARLADAWAQLHPPGSKGRAVAGQLQAAAAGGPGAHVDGAAGPGGDRGGPPGPGPGGAALGGPGPAESKFGASWWQQTRVLMFRCLRQRRFQSLDNLRVVQVVAITVLSSILWGRVAAPGGRGSGGGHGGGGGRGHGYDPATAPPMSAAQLGDVNGLLFFMCSFWSFLPAFSALFAFPEHRLMLRKDRKAGMYHLSAFYVAYSVADVPLELALPVAFLCVVYWATGLAPTAAAFFGTLFVLLLSVLVASSIGMLLGALFASLKSAQAAASVIMMCIFLAGGFLVRHLPVWASWLRYLSFISYTLEAVSSLQLNQRTYVCGPAGAAACPLRGSDVFAPIEIGGAAVYGKDVAVLAGIMIGLRVLIYLALRIRK